MCLYLQFTNILNNNNCYSTILQQTIMHLMLNLILQKAVIVNDYLYYHISLFITECCYFVLKSLTATHCLNNKHKFPDFQNVKLIINIQKGNNINI